MDPTSREDLSALMDGELAAEPTRFLLRRLGHDPDLSATWSRWHLIRACLASDPARMSTQKTDRDFAARVAAGVRGGPPARGTRQRHWAQYVGGGAIAAGVAVAALLLNSPVTRTGTPTTARAPETTVPVTLAAAPPATGLGTATPPWLLQRQPTVLGAQPASADVVYGTGLMQPDYLRRATYARDAAFPFASSLRSGQPGLPFSIVLMPESPRSSAAAAH